ncbi:MAG: ATP-binding protein [Treponema sp.]|nr:ATP-binding protein [Treponema sp.]
MKLSEILEIYTSQKQSLEKQEFGQKRLILDDLPDIQSHVLVISGIRRCGKSTLLRQFTRKLNRPFFYLSFDDIRLVSFTSADYALLDKAIEESGSRFIFFDEIQSAENWELYIRQKLDEGYQIAITGSNASLLSRELGSRLTGRHISKELFPFSYIEFCGLFGLKYGNSSFFDYLEKGGFPEFLKTGNIDILTQLQSDILYRDITARYGIRDTASLRQLFVYLLSNTSQLFSPSKLTNIIGVKSPTTVLEYISFFESAYLIQLLPCFAWSLKAQSLAPKKVYICDTGLIKTGSVSFNKNYGALLENFVYNNFRRRFSSSLSLNGIQIFYFSGKNGGECDFIVKSNEVFNCIQVCWELNPENQDREINGLLDAMDFFNLNEGEILTYNTEDLILINGKKIYVKPAWKRFSQID